MIDYHTGAIRTLLGNIDPNSPKDGAFRCGLAGLPSARLHPLSRSSMQTAFEQGVSPGLTGSTILLFTVPMCCGLPSYSPTNYDLR